MPLSTERSVCLSLQVRSDVRRTDHLVSIFASACRLAGTRQKAGRVKEVGAVLGGRYGRQQQPKRERKGFCFLCFN